ncbi:MAG: hypothetical protein OH319_00075 [Candidatus Parvarchaeota archaeon]|nr:hypothetical protein [Candidatus Jingweiarchaeum tengchongense]MCW1298456.1 hypothetical protein [Candidatus Jingweiarchaeum tengchongense]MCW1300548.1 hypothetical protein [Candidatus Jingweiarchaeum tengchongense]MCW1304977.1 hypothetical protein [Candidatus Jingweiarchaeum tengchongense]MCW1309298.1 hypothetical protein [Candidatus Jingweiarchaeum tengchongense]
MEIFSQIFITFSLIMGALIGEILTTRVLGVLKRALLLILEAFVFVIITILILSSIYIESFSLEKLILIYFSCGFISIVFSRILISLFGFLSIKIEEKNKNKFDEETIIISLGRNLARRGFSKEEIINLLRSSGFNDKKIEKVFRSLEIKPNLKIKEKFK